MTDIARDIGLLLGLQIKLIKAEPGSEQEPGRERHNASFDQALPPLAECLIPPPDNAGDDIVVEFVPKPVRALLIAQNPGGVEFAQHRLQFMGFDVENLGQHVFGISHLGPILSDEKGKCPRGEAALASRPASHDPFHVAVDNGFRAAEPLIRGQADDLVRVRVLLLPQSVADNLQLRPFDRGPRTGAAARPLDIGPNRFLPREIPAQTIQQGFFVGKPKRAACHRPHDGFPSLGRGQFLQAVVIGKQVGDVFAKHAQLGQKILAHRQHHRHRQ